MRLSAISRSAHYAGQTALPAPRVSPNTSSSAALTTRNPSVSVPSVTRDLSVLVVVVPFALLFRILIAYTYNRTAYAVVIAALTHASFNEASEIISPTVPGASGQVLAFVSTALLALLFVCVSRGRLAHLRQDGSGAA